MATEKFVIDFDSAQTNIFMLGGGVVLSEPTVCAIATDDKNQIKAVGEDAWRLIGKTAKNTKIVFPVFEGEIVNEKVAIATLKAFLSKIKQKGSFSGAQVLFPVPCGVTAEMVEKYKNVAKACGINKTCFVEAPILSALGQRIPMNDSSPCFIIDMAGGTTNIAAVSLDGVIAGISVNFGGNKISTDIIDYVAETYDLQIGLLTAEKLKKEIGSLDENDTLSAVVNGRDLKTGAPRSISLKAMDIVVPVKRYFDKIADLAIAVLRKLPPEVSAEIRHAGIYVSGISSSIYGLDNYYSNKFQMQINVAEYGNSSVALGGGVAVGNNALLKKIALKTK